MRLEFVEYTLPVYWASALINNDESGLGSIEILEMNQWLESEAKNYEQFYCTGVDEDKHFAWDNDATGIGGDVATFTFQV